MLELAVAQMGNIIITLSTKATFREEEELCYNEACRSLAAFFKMNRVSWEKLNEADGDQEDTESSGLPA